MKKFSFALCGALLASLSFAAHAAVTIERPWVRATVAQQGATAAFFEIRSDQDAQLVAASSPAARRVELHQMSMAGDVMQMRALDALPLPAGKVVTLAPAGFHLMLFGLKAPLRAGDRVPLTLTIESRDGKRDTVDVTAEVHPVGAMHP